MTATTALGAGPVAADHIAGHAAGRSLPSIVLDFEDAQSPVGTQYESRGVTFAPEAVVHSDLPRGPALARSGSKALRPGPPGCGNPPVTTTTTAYGIESGSDFSAHEPSVGRQLAASSSSPCEPLSMVLSPPASALKAWVGRYAGCPPNTDVRLEGFDAAERSVGSTVVTLDGGARSAGTLVTLAPRAAMASAKLGFVGANVSGAGCAPDNTLLLVDDIEIEAPVAAAAPRLIDFGDAGTNAARTVRVTSAGLTDLVVQRRPAITGTNRDDFVVSGEDCTPYSGPGSLAGTVQRPLPPGAACTIEVVFRPTGSGDRSAVLEIPTNDPQGPARVQLEGTARTSPAGSSAKVTPDRLDFGQARTASVGATRAVTVAAAGGPAVDVAEVWIEPPTGDFSLAGAACSGTTLKAGTSCVVEVRFRPGGAGLRAATLQVTAGSPRAVHKVALSGVGVAADVAAATLIPDQLDLGPAGVGGNPQTRSLTVANSGTAPLDIKGTSIAGPESSDFTVDAAGCPAKVAPGATCTLEVRFQPGAAGPRTATLSVRTSAADSPHLVPLRGNGTDVAPPEPTGGRLEVSPGSGHRGAEVAIVGTGFSGRTEISWHSQPPGTRLAVVVADHSGRIDLSVNVPTDATLGDHEVVACDARGKCARAAFDVEASVAPGGGGSRLVALLIALVLMAAAVAALAFKRRQLLPLPRRSRPPPASGGPPTSYGGGWPDREVRSGFAPAGDYHTGLDPSEPLQPGRPYHFWVELGPAVATAAASTAPLTVALFDYPGELEIDPAADTGQLELRGDGSIRVARQGGLHTQPRPGDELLGRRVFFPLRAPATEGRHRLRCSLYSHQVLVQSWVVSADVHRRTGAGGDGADPQARERDYVLSRSLDPAVLSRMRHHSLSVMVNDNDVGTHGLRLLGEGGFKSSATFDVAELSEHGNQVRRALRRVACGAEEMTDAQAAYRYDDEVDLERLRVDLSSLARRGYRVYSAIVHDLARGAPGEVGTAAHLAQILRRPGCIQLCAKRGARHYLPASLVYDRPLDDAIADLVLCPAFAEAMSSESPLDASPCFQGKCPTWGEPDVVCPGGFWGFRHVISLPQSLGDAEGAPSEVPLELATNGELVLDVGVSTDPGFTYRPLHEEVLRSLHPRLDWNYGDSRESVLEVLRTTQPHLVYFYCHGGLDESSGTPFIEVGPPGATPITGSNLLAYNVLWDRSHPLVVVNGCHTTALGPNTPLELVSAFVEHSQAAGVIGTEITVFEPLACAFAEELLRRMLSEGLSVGEAVQQARLALLHRGNPLGLAYVAFVAGDLRFVVHPSEASVGVAAR